MTSHDVSVRVARAFDTYCYEPPHPGSTIGVPWPAEKVDRHRDELRAHLVEPSLRRVELRDTVAQIRASTPSFAEVWVVAEFGRSLVFYDPDADEFGLAEQSEPTRPPVAIGVRGDLIGVYCSA